MALNSNLKQGLEANEATKRRGEYGPNQLQEPPPRSLIQMIYSQIKEVLVLILIAAAIISAALGEIEDSGVILVIVVLNAALGAFQESRAEQALRALKKLTQPMAKVLRDGRPDQVPAADLVPGDVVLLEAGDYVPADARLIEVASLAADESALTGESVPVEKTAEVLSGQEVTLGDQKNMVFMGTVITAGRGQAIVVDTGMRTQIGRIASMLQQVEQEPTPLQRRLAELGKYLGVIALAVVAVVFIAGLLRGEELLEMFMTSVSLAVAAVPEGLPAVVTIVLALGVQRMSRRQAIIRKLAAVETLGTATTICSDKTGTLTKNEMTVAQIYTSEGVWKVTGVGYAPRGEFIAVVHSGPESKPVTEGSEEAVDQTGEKAAQALDETGTQGSLAPALERMLIGGALASDAWLTQDNHGHYRIVGDPTEGALVVAAAKAGFTREGLNRDYPRVGEVPFDSDRKMMTTFHQVPPDRFGAPVVSFTKGAPDIVLERCQSWYGPDGEVAPLNDADKQKLLEANSKLASQGMRVLALATRSWLQVPEEMSSEAVESDMTFVGLFAMQDPARPEVARAVDVSRQAGIRPVMITGDHQTTAVAIAKEIGIYRPGDQVLTGLDLERASDEELEAAVLKTSVYARVSPHHKLRIVKALRAHQQVVAMTGDGVNDAPALRQADIGVAMGITGTEVAKEASDMVLMDDNFATIVNAIEEGRTIYANIRKTIHYLLSCNIGEIVAIFLAIVIGMGSPLTPIQILWLNLVTDGFPALALGLEGAEKGVMQRPPRGAKEGIFAGGLGIQIGWQGILIGGLSFTAYALAIARGRSLVEAHTMAFLTMSLSQLFHAFNVRGPMSLVKMGLLSNRYLVGAFGLSAALQLAVILVPPLREIFDTALLAASDWLMVVGLSFMSIVVVEVVKAFTGLGASQTGMSAPLG